MRGDQELTATPAAEKIWFDLPLSAHPDEWPVEDIQGDAQVATETDQVMKPVQLYLQELRAHGIRVRRAFLFGSHARHDACAESDIDLAVISEDFTGNRFTDRRRIVPLRRAIDSRIEPFPFDPQTFSRGGILVDEIKQTGVNVPLLAASALSIVQPR